MANIEVLKTEEQNEEAKVLTPDEVSDPPKSDDEPKEETKTSWFKRAVGHVKDFGHEVKEHLPLVGVSTLVGAGLGVGGVIALDRLLGNKTEERDDADQLEQTEVPEIEEPKYEMPEMVPIPTPEEREVDVD